MSGKFYARKGTMNSVESTCLYLEHMHGVAQQGRRAELGGIDD
jgi:hypothetical protein